MKHFVSGVVTFFILLFAYTKIAGPLPFSVTSVTTQKTDTFNVTADGKAAAAPDIALVNVGVQAQGGTVKQAQQELNSAINKVAEAIKKVGVEAKDIQTSGYNLTPTYDYREGRGRITGYQANSNLTVKVREIEKANQVIDAATVGGANQVGGVSFDIDDKTKVENEARQKAVAEAKKKAEEAAKIAGFRLGRIINYSENFGPGPRPIPMLTKTEMAAGGAPTQIEPGTNEITVSVTLSYEIK